MAIAIGNKTASNQNPNGSSQTLAHNMSAGTDGTLMVVVTMSSQNSRNFTGATYNGVAMTLLRNQLYSGLVQRTAVYILQAPSTGSNNFVVTFNGSQFNPTSIFACSFTGAGAGGVNANNGASTAPNSQSLTIAANSIIYAQGISDNVQSASSIGGSSRALEFTHNTNKQVGGALSALGLPAGATNVTTDAITGTITNLRIEILGGGGGGARRRIIIT